MLLVVTGAILLLGSLLVKSIKQKKRIEEKIQTLPKFSFQKIPGGNFESSFINNNTPCLIIYFHPECEHCHYEAEQIRLNIDRFNESQIIMISTASRESLKDFADNYHLLECDNISILIDTSDVFTDTFGPNPFPTTFVYNKNKKLVKHFKGEVKIEALLNYLKQ